MASKITAVILAAGGSTRTHPLTVAFPKPLLKVLSTSIIGHNLGQLEASGCISRAIVVVGFMKDMLIEKLGKRFGSIDIEYAEQKERNGTGGALLCCRKMLKGRFIVINGDDIYSADDIRRAAGHEYCIVGKEVEDASKWGVISLKGGFVESISEKPDNPESKLANIGVYALSERIFDFQIEKSARGELEITEYVNRLVKAGERVRCEKVKGYWLPVGYPWGYLEANIFFLRKMKKSRIMGKVEKGAYIRGTTHIGEGTIIKSGAYIEGPVYIGRNCEIGPGAFLRKDTIIFDNVRTRAEIVDSVLMEGATAKHACYIGHSVIGRNANIGAGTITSDYRHDGKEHVTIVNGKKVRTGRRKLGAFIGDGAKTGIGTLIYPGRKIWPGMTTLPGEIVTKDKKEE